MNQHHARMQSFDTGRPFTRADAIRAGVSPKVLRGSRFRRIFRGVYVDADVPDSPVLRARAALLLFGDRRAVVSHASAGRIAGVPLPALPDEHITVLRPQDRRQHAGVRVHVAQETRVRDIEGMAVSSYDRMFIELAGLLSLVDLVVVGDNLVRRGLLSPRDLIDACASTRHPSARQAARAARLVRPEVDSPMETRLRLLLVFAGLPEPEVNRKIRAADGEVRRRFDLSYPAVRVIVEYDGRDHVERIEKWESDLERREEIDDAGWRILVVTSSGIYRHPQHTVMRVWRVLLARGLQGLPNRPSRDYLLHFPGRD